MKTASYNAFRLLRRNLMLLAVTAAMNGPFVSSQEELPPVADIPEDAIQQGRNRGVETWEGTLFGQDSYKPGSYAQIEVVPNPGFEFDRWEGPAIADAAEAKTFVTMEDHATIKPHYRRIWNVIAAPDNKEAGEVKGSGDYPDGTEVTLSVEPNEGFTFLGWEGKGIREEEKEALETTIVADGDHDIIARFENDNQDQNSGGGGGSDQNQDQDQNEDSSENQDEQQDQQDPNESESDQNQNQESPDQPDSPDEPQNQDGDPQPEQPDTGEEDPPEPEEQNENGENEQEEPGSPPQPQDGEDEAAPEEAPPGGQPMPLQMTPEEALRLLEAMEGEEKKLPLFIVPPQDKKDSKKDW